MQATTALNTKAALDYKKWLPSSAVRATRKRTFRTEGDTIPDDEHLNRGSTWAHHAEAKPV